MFSDLKSACLFALFIPMYTFSSITNLNVFYDLLHKTRGGNESQLCEKKPRNCLIWERSAGSRWNQSSRSTLITWGRHFITHFDRVLARRATRAWSPSFTNTHTHTHPNTRTLQWWLELYWNVNEPLAGLQWWGIQVTTRKALRTNKLLSFCTDI